MSKKNEILAFVAVAGVAAGSIAMNIRQAETIDALKRADSTKDRIVAMYRTNLYQAYRHMTLPQLRLLITRENEDAQFAAVIKDFWKK